MPYILERLNSADAEEVQADMAVERFCQKV